MFLMYRKDRGEWNYRWSSALKTCTALIVGIFKRICCFKYFCYLSVFLMVLTSTEQLFIERPFFRCFLRNNHLPYIYSKQKQSPGGVLKNFAKLTRKHQCQILFLIKLQSLGPDIKRPWHRCLRSSEFCEISKNIFSERTPPVDASV